MQDVDEQVLQQPLQQLDLFEEPAEALYEVTLEDRMTILRHLKSSVIAERLYFLHNACAAVFSAFKLIEALLQSVSVGEDSANQSTFFSTTFIQNALCVYLLNGIIKKDSGIKDALEHRLCEQLKNNRIEAEAVLSKKRWNDVAMKIIKEIAGYVQQRLVLMRAKLQGRKIRRRSMGNLQNHFRDSESEENQLKHVYERASLRLEQRIMKQVQQKRESSVSITVVYERLTETSDFSKKLLVAFSSVSVLIVCLISIGATSTERSVELSELALVAALGLPAVVLILPSGLHLAQAFGTVAFLVAYALQILLQLTYCVIVSEVQEWLRKRKIVCERAESHKALIGATCSICILEIEENSKELSEIAILPCNHPFHYDCIRLWLTNKNDCPLCRHPI